MRILSIFTALFAFTHSAYAHGGHVGELAGHAHWVGVAAGVAAVAIAVAVAKGKKAASAKSEQDEASSDEASNDEIGKTA